MNVLSFDTETNGIKGDLIQIGYTLKDLKNDRVIFERSKLIEVSDVVKWNQKAYDVHRIRKEDCLAKGENIIQELLLFQAVVKLSNVIIAHNLEYDRTVMIQEFAKNNLFLTRNSGTQMICTMKTTKNLFGGKWPKLEALHQHLFDKSFDGAHDAYQDSQATLRIFEKLLDKGHYENIL